MRSYHFVLNSGHITRKILALPQSDSDNNNNATFVRLFNTNPESPGLLSATRNHTYNLDFAIVITQFGGNSFFLAFAYGSEGSELAN